MSDVGCRISGSRMSDVGCRMSHVGWHLQASVSFCTKPLKLRIYFSPTTPLDLVTDVLKHRFACYRQHNVGCRMSDVGSRMSDLGSRMSDVGWRMADVGCRMSHVGWHLQTSVSFRTKPLKLRIYFSSTTPLDLVTDVLKHRFACYQQHKD